MRAANCSYDPMIIIYLATRILRRVVRCGRVRLYLRSGSGSRRSALGARAGQLAQAMAQSLYRRSSKMKLDRYSREHHKHGDERTTGKTAKADTKQSRKSEG